jgi:hypothetical protein
VQALLPVLRRSLGMTQKDLERATGRPRTCQNERLGQLFSPGGRPQRVRFPLASHFQTFDQMDELLGTETASIVKALG